MKRLILVLVILVMVPVVVIAGESGEKKTYTAKECSAIALLAKTIMDVRQNGMPMSMVIDSVTDENMKGLVTRMAILAYERPKFSTESYKQNAINEFENQFYLNCMKQVIVE
jgi:hypothetical protein